MTVYFLNRFFYPDQSATSQVLTDVVWDLAGRGLNVCVVTSRQRYENPGACLAKRETIHGVHVRRVWATTFGRDNLLGRAVDCVTFYLSCFFFLVTHLKKNNTVVALTDPPLISVVALAAVRLSGARLVNWIQDLFPEVAQTLGVPVAGGLAGKILRSMRNASLKAAVMNVAIGEIMAEKIAAMGVAPKKISILHNGSDGRQIKPMDRDENPLRLHWGLGRRMAVMYSGNMGRAHELDTILQAAALLKDRKDIVFLFIGGGKQKEALQAQSAVMGLENILFKPYQPQELLGQSLTAADVHLVCLKPALEGLIVPSKFYGALAAGRVVVNIGDPKGEIGRWITRIGCGQTIHPGEADRLAEALKTYSADEAGRQRVGYMGRAYFEKNFDRAISSGFWYHLLEQKGLMEK